MNEDKLLKWTIFFLLFPLCFIVFLIASSGYNTYQHKYSVSIKKFEKEFTIDKAEIEGGKYRNVCLTVSNDNGTIKLSVYEIPINKTKFIVIFETFKQPNGKEFTTQTFGGYQ